MANTKIPFHIPNQSPFITLIFILMTTITSTVSQNSISTCTLDFQFSYSDFNGDTEVTGWGGFLSKSSCGIAFYTYLLALARRANLTGQIYLNAIEQRNCLTSIKEFKGDVLSCGIEKLTSVGGGCSEFSVSMVSLKFGHELKSLEQDCEFLGFDGEWDKRCGSCARRWEEIKLSLSREFGKTEIDVCRFAVLVTLTSHRFDDEKWVHPVFRCLGEKNFTTAAQQEGSGVRKNKNRRSFCILIGGLIGVGVMIFITSWILFKKLTKSNAPQEKKASKEKLPEEPGFKKIPKIPIKEIYSATNNLNMANFIGQGTAGKVYKGILSTNQNVAVKHIINDGDMETFVREVTSLSHVKHPNLVSLLGYCVEEDECFLVYELCTNGNLSEWLFGEDKVLSWIQRLEIMIDSAQGLQFLHTYPEGCIVHRDIKPTNILLGGNIEAKLSDFGLSKVMEVGESYVSSEVRGTFGYVDPEYQKNRHVNSAGDVYSFGIVLLQILSGRRVINLNVKKPMHLDKMAKLLLKGGKVSEFADPKLNGEYSMEAFDITMKLALSCTAQPQQRPSMEQVLTKLEKAINISTRLKAPTPNATPNRDSSP